MWRKWDKMDVLKEIAHPIEAFRKAFEASFATSFQSSSGLVQDALTHVNATTGKHIRPLLLGLCAGLCGSSPTEESVNSAVLLELLHSSSLIHDDVIDQSPRRRGALTLNAMYSNHVAVLVGDYLLSMAFMRATESGNKELMRIAASVGKELSEGELRQIEAAQSHEMTTEEQYITIIEKKTAALFEAFAFLGARSVGATNEQLLLCASIGKNLGYAFQIKDDILDYSPSKEIGKPTGNDILEGKITLPLIHAYKESSAQEQENLRMWIARAPEDPQALTLLMDYVHRSKGIGKAHEKLLEYAEKAIEAIQLFPQSPYRTSLLRLVDFLIGRNY